MSRSRRLRPFAPLVACLALGIGGCVATEPLFIASTAVSAATLTATKKTVTDHIVSAATGRDCSFVSWSETGEYCPEQIVVDRSDVYCYRTLGGVDCHNLPDPYKNSQTSLASPPPVRKTVTQKGWFD